MKKVDLGSLVDGLETLMPLILELEDQYEKAKIDPWKEMDDLWKHYVGSPAFILGERLTEKLGGAKIYLKRDELNHTGAPR